MAKVLVVNEANLNTTYPKKSFELARLKVENCM